MWLCSGEQCGCVGDLTRSWLVELESSSGNGLETPRATQLAKMANRMKISNGLRHVKEAQHGQN